MEKLIFIVLAFSLLSFTTCEDFDDNDDGVVIEDENVSISYDL